MHIKIIAIYLCMQISYGLLGAMPRRPRPRPLWRHVRAARLAGDESHADAVLLSAGRGRLGPYSTLVVNLHT